MVDQWSELVFWLNAQNSKLILRGIYYTVFRINFLDHAVVVTAVSLSFYLAFHGQSYCNQEQLEFKLTPMDLCLKRFEEG